MIAKIPYKKSTVLLGSGVAAALMAGGLLQAFDAPLVYTAVAIVVAVVLVGFASWSATKLRESLS